LDSEFRISCMRERRRGEGTLSGPPSTLPSMRKHLPLPGISVSGAAAYPASGPNSQSLAGQPSPTSAPVPVLSSALVPGPSGTQIPAGYAPASAAGSTPPTLSRPSLLGAAVSGRGGEGVCAREIKGKGRESEWSKWIEGGMRGEGRERGSLFEGQASIRSFRMRTQAAASPHAGPFSSALHKASNLFSGGSSTKSLNRNSNVSATTMAAAAAAAAPPPLSAPPPVDASRSASTTAAAPSSGAWAPTAGSQKGSLKGSNKGSSKGDALQVANLRDLLRYTERHLLRIYPAPWRLQSG
jgi:hypothetical protein